MAKAKKFSNGYTWVINPDTKNTTWVYNGTDSADYYRLDAQFSKKDFEKFYNVPTRKGDDLVVTTIFLKLNYSTKTVTTTIKNFFTDIWANGSEMEIITCLEGSPYKIYSDFDNPGRKGYFGTPQDTAEKDYIMASDAKKATLTLSLGGSDKVVDLKGDDTYTLSYQYKDNNNENTGNDTIIELKGNDSYNIDDYGFAEIDDYNGKDSYNAIGTYATAIIQDYKGNDNYNTGDNGYIQAVDYAGNDKYYLSGNKVSYVGDVKGNDKYYIKNSKSEDVNDLSIIFEESGKDYYEVTNSKGVYLYDYKGKDKYVISSSTGLDHTHQGTGIYVWDKGKSKDTYIYNNVKNNALYKESEDINDDGGADKYDLTAVEKFVVRDMGGNDKYAVKKETNNIYIEDNGGKDKYTFTGSLESIATLIKDVEIVDNGAKNDKYNFKYVANHIAYQNDQENYRTVKDDGGNDTYNASDSYAVVVEDEWGNDKYNFSTTTSMETACVVTDNDGKDTYNVQGKYNKKSKITSRVIFTGISDKGADKDTYKFNYAQNVTINDDGGKNTFNIKNSSSVYIETTGKNSFNYKNIYKGYIEASGDYTDTYNIDSVGEYTIEDFGSAKDKYNIKASSSLTLSDNGGDDSYNISKMKDKIYIFDGGGNDTLKLTDVKKKNIVVMANIREDGHYDNNSAILYNKSNGSYIVITNFFSQTDGSISGFDNGRIETMKAGKQTISVDYNYINQVKGQVAGFLSTGDTVIDVLEHQDTQFATLQNIIACFTK